MSGLMGQLELKLAMAEEANEKSQATAQKVCVEAAGEERKQK
jgi:hypothetical protein